MAFTDADGQFDFSDITKFIEKKDESDLILGYRLKRADSFARVLFTFGWSSLARIILGLKARDYSCGFKMIKKEVYNAVLPLVGEEKVTQIELLVKARKMGFKFSEVGVNHYPRASGKQTGANLKVVVKSVFDMFKLWGKMHNIRKVEVVAIVAILAIGAFSRLYRIDGYMTFLGDEGRDVVIVRRLLTEVHPPLIGPGTSIGNMYLGPIYYYMMAPFLFLAGYSPVGPAVMIALLGTITILFVWWVGREWFSRLAGIIAATLYAVSPTVVIYSKSSWNPNIMPFFALLCVYSIWRVWKRKEYKWLVICSISFAFVMQSHYLGLLLAPTLFIFWLLSKVPIRYTVISAVIFLLLMSPLAVFDIRHGYINFLAMKKFFTIRQETVSIVPWKAIPNVWPIYQNIIERLPAGRNVIAGLVLSISLVAGFLWTLVGHKRNIFKSPYFLLFTWFIFALVGLGLYKQHIYDHYYGFLFPAPFLLFGAFSKEIIEKKRKLGIAVVSISTGALVIISLLGSPLKNPPNMQLQRAIVVADEIKRLSEGKRFNFALIADQNYEAGYRYFLNLNSANVVDIDPQNYDATIAENLFVVCEKVPEKCDPTHSPKAEVASFGWSKIEEEWKIYGVTLYKLSHTK